MLDTKTWTTNEDEDLRRIDFVKNKLRRRPLLPPDPTNANEDYPEVQSGISFPIAHCAVRGCPWTLDKDMPGSIDSVEIDIERHIRDNHAAELQLENAGADTMAYYCAAIAERERENMPLIGPSIDRRVFKWLQHAANSERVQSLICFICCQVKTEVACFRDTSDIRYHDGSIFERAYASGSTNLNCSLAFFRTRYANEADGDANPFKNAADIADDCWEWRRVFLFADGKRRPSMDMLCCPEDVKHCGGEHPQTHICKKCQVPVCTECWRRLVRRNDFGIPMALCNDNFWGYTTSIIFKYKVRWIEAAIVSPCWTSMLCFYVEGDYGHLMTEELGGKSYRTMVKGTCFSVHMPWEDILESLRDNCDSSDLAHLPREEECLKYMLRLHLKVGGIDFSKHLRQVHVRPFVLILLLNHLIDQGHEVFRGKGAPETLKQKMRAAVDKHYPEREAHLPEDERQGVLPPSIQQVLKEEEDERRSQLEIEHRENANNEAAVAKALRARVLTDKNATPSDGPRPLEQCFEDIRPKSFTLDRSTAACTDPATLRAGGLQRYGEMNVQAGSRFINQWESKYFSQVMPFIIPRMVSGPDYDSTRRWRRKEDAPIVTSMEFTRAFPRRAESAGRIDWTAVPIIRSVNFKYTAEHTMFHP